MNATVLISFGKVCPQTGPLDDGTHYVEFKTAAGEALAISISGSEAAAIRHFQERMPQGLFVPEVVSE